MMVSALCGLRVGLVISVFRNFHTTSYGNYRVHSVIGLCEIIPLLGVIFFPNTNTQELRWEALTTRTLFCLTHWLQAQTQMATTLESTSVRHRSDTEVLGRCLLFEGLFYQGNDLHIEDDVFHIYETSFVWHHQLIDSWEISIKSEKNKQFSC